MGPRIASLLVLVLAAALAGCLGATDAPPEPASGGAAGRGEAGQDATASLAEPPTWKPGDWWKVKFTNPAPAAEGATYTTTRVVAGTHDGSYLVGMPPSGFSDKMLIWHMPGFGNVDQANLGFLVHGEGFKPLEFPLEEGKTWETTFAGGLTAEVTSIEDGEATVTFDGTSPGGRSYRAMELVYDADEGFIESLESFPGPLRGQTASHGRYEVVDHGHGYAGEVMVPEGRREVFFRLRGAAVVGGPSPTGSAEVPEDVDRITLAHVLGEFHSHGTTTGRYQITTTTPGGRTIQDQLAPGSAPGRHVSYYGIWDPAGTWSFEHVAAGTGATVAEGIGYGVRNVTLPLS